MTQDAPLDQKAPIDADVLRKLVPGFRLDWSGLRNRFDDIAARLDKLTTYESRAAYLDEIARNFEDAVSDALSRRVPASGGELAGWLHKTTGALVDTAGKDEIVARFKAELGDVSGDFAPVYLAASPIVAAPEGWLLVPVEPTEEMLEAGAQYGLDGEGVTDSWLAHAGRYYAAMLAAAPSIPEGKAEPAGQHDALPEYDPTSPLSVAEHIYAQCEQTVLSLNGLPEHSRDALISVFGHFKKLELAALSTPPGAPHE